MLKYFHNMKKTSSFGMHQVFTALPSHNPTQEEGEFQKEQALKSAFG